MMRIRLQAAWSEFRAQLAGSAALRMGLLAVVALLWTYALLLAGEAVEATRKGNAALRAEVERLAPLARERGWPERADEARRQRDALDAMLWTGSDAGLVEAGLQDWLRATAAQWGVNIRELEIARGETSASASAKGVSTRVLRVHLATDLKTVPMLGFLSELGQSARLVLVERLALRQAAQPPLAELELKVVLATPAAGKAGR